MVYHDVLSLGAEVSEKYYLGSLRHLRESVCRKRQNLCKLHRDNAHDIDFLRIFVQM